MMVLTDHTRGHSVRSRDGVLIGHLWLLWLIWGHVVTMTRLTDTGAVSSTATHPTAVPE